MHAEHLPKSPRRSQSTFRRALSAFGAISLLLGVSLWAPGCAWLGGGCDTGCDGNKAVLCSWVDEADGPSPFDTDFDCPSGTTCTERDGKRPVCVSGKQAACELSDAQTCTDGVPTSCVALSDGTNVLASSSETGFSTCAANQTCVAFAEGGAGCTTTTMKPCTDETSESCSDGIPSICVKLADGRLVWSASLVAEMQPTTIDDGRCPSGSTCGMIGENAFCLVDGAAPCVIGKDAERCLGTDGATDCIGGSDGAFVEIANVCKGCTEDQGSTDCL